MPTDGKKQACGSWEQLDTEELLELVRMDLDPPEGGDYERTARILEVIERREEESPTGILPDVDQAWEDFQKYYVPLDSEGCPLYPMRDPNRTSAGRGPDGRPRRGRLLRRLVPVAAVAAVTLSSMVAAQAFGLDVFGTLARWTEETFHFVSGTTAAAGSEESESIRQEIQEVYDRCGVTVPAPAWYPEGTELLGDIEEKEQEGTSVITCNLTYGDKAFYIEAQQYHGGERIPVHTFEKDTSNIEEYRSNGRLFYVMSNIPDSRATYSNDQVVIVIEGNLSLEVLKQLIDSIGA